MTAASALRTELEPNANTTTHLILAAQRGDQAAKDRLVRENTGLIWTVVKRFAGRGTDVEDLFQIGAIGLIKCIDKFDMSFGVKFSTYAVPMIIGEIRRFLRDDGMVKVARPLKEMAAKAGAVSEKLAQRNGKPPTIGEIAAELDVDAGELVLALEAGREVESIYKTVNQNGESPVYLLDRIGGAANAGREDENLTTKIALRELIADLGEKERTVIVLRYFRDMTQSDVAKVIGVSQVQVSRIEKKVLRALREKLT